MQIRKVSCIYIGFYYSSLPYSVPMSSLKALKNYLYSTWMHFEKANPDYSCLSVQINKVREKKKSKKIHVSIAQGSRALSCILIPGYLRAFFGTLLHITELFSTWVGSFVTLVTDMTKYIFISYIHITYIYICKPIKG